MPRENYLPLSSDLAKRIVGRIKKTMYHDSRSRILARFQVLRRKKREKVTLNFRGETRICMHLLVLRCVSYFWFLLKQKKLLFESVLKRTDGFSVRFHVYRVCIRNTERVWFITNCFRFVRHRWKGREGKKSDLKATVHSCCSRTIYILKSNKNTLKQWIFIYIYIYFFLPLVVDSPSSYIASLSSDRNRVYGKWNYSFLHCTEGRSRGGAMGSIVLPRVMESRKN